MSSARSVPEAVEEAYNSVYFEKQEGQLCLQHALNNGFQQNFYDPVVLAQIATELDQLELSKLDPTQPGSTPSIEDEIRDLGGRLTDAGPSARSGSGSQRKGKPKRMGGGNFDDTGFFNVQVLEKALSVHNLELVRVNTAYIARLRVPIAMSESLIICNRQEHWYCFRKLGEQWFQLDSTWNGPKEITKDVLTMELSTYSALEGSTDAIDVFLVKGELPRSESNDLWSKLPMDSKGNYAHVLNKRYGYRLGGWDGQSTQVINNTPKKHKGYRLGGSKSSASGRSLGPSSDSAGATGQSSSGGTSTASLDPAEEAKNRQAELRAQRLAYLEKQYPRRNIQPQDKDKE